jgi:hypothetical protein
MAQKPNIQPRYGDGTIGSCDGRRKSKTDKESGLSSIEELPGVRAKAG